MTVVRPPLVTSDSDLTGVAVHLAELDRVASGFDLLHSDWLWVRTLYATSTWYFTLRYVIYHIMMEDLDLTEPHNENKRPQNSLVFAP